MKHDELTAAFARDGEADERGGIWSECFHCGCVNKPVIPVGLGNFGACFECLVTPGARWRMLKTCPFCGTPDDQGRICDACRAEGAWRAVEYIAAKGRKLPNGPRCGVERRNIERMEGKAS